MSASFQLSESTQHKKMLKSLIKSFHPLLMPKLFIIAAASQLLYSTNPPTVVFCATVNYSRSVSMTHKHTQTHTTR